MSAGMVPRKVIRATVTEMCIHSMRFLEFSVFAMTPKRTKKRPMPAGIRAVGWALPVETNPTMPRRTSRMPKPMVSFAMMDGFLVALASGYPSQAKVRKVFEKEGIGLDLGVPERAQSLAQGQALCYHPP